ncbi:MAG: hypothetical protein JRI92_13380 [Deltaproteobacteria bacterium]|nr:hypothetical protein [Deltaproteobacteria bacterium]
MRFDRLVPVERSGNDGKAGEGDHSSTVGAPNMLDNSIFICTISCTGGALWKL